MLLTVVEPLAQLAEVHVGQFSDVLVPDLVRQGLAVQALPVTFRTLAFCQELLGPFLSAARLVVLHHRAQVFHHTVVVDEIVAGGMYQFLVDAHRLQRSVEYLVESLVRNIVDGSLDVTLVVMQDGSNLPEYHLVLIFAQRGDGSVVDALFPVGNHLAQVDLVDVAETLAPRTGTLGGIERKSVRRWVTVRYACGRTHQAAREMLDLTRLIVDNHDETLALLHGDLHGLLQALTTGYLIGSHL